MSRVFKTRKVHAIERNLKQEEARVASLYSQTELEFEAIRNASRHLNNIFVEIEESNRKIKRIKEVLEESELERRNWIYKL